jgi:hypothetical protein
MRRHLRRLRGRPLLRPPAEECLSVANRSSSDPALACQDKVRGRDRANLPQDKTGRQCDPENAAVRIRRALGRPVRVHRSVRGEESELHHRLPLAVPWAVRRVRDSVTYRVG